MHRIILSIVACVALGFSARAQADLNERLPQDPEMVIGKLPNGITYYIRHNETPKGQAFFSIIRDAGSLLEEPGQEGLAHFLEHMAFQGTENFPGRGVVETLERHGVRYGYDINAVTNESETVYHFGGVPTDDGKFLDTCVMILHDWSYYLTLDKADIDNERKVIEEEWNMKNTPDNRIQDQISEVVFKGSKYAGRDAIGSLEVIRNFDPGELRAFYHKWYRTDLEAVAIIGDFDVKQMERRVKKILSKVPTVENPEPRPFFEIPDHEEPYYCMATDPGAGTGSSISLLTLHRDMSSEAKGTVAYLKEEAMIQLFNRLMSARMAKALQKPDCPLAQAGIAYVYFKRGYYSYQVGGVPKNDEESALRTLLTENERLVRHGFTDEEVEDAKRGVAADGGERLPGQERHQQRGLRRDGEGAFPEGEPDCGHRFPIREVEGTDCRHHRRGDARKGEGVEHRQEPDGGHHGLGHGVAPDGGRRGGHCRRGEGGRRGAVPVRAGGNHAAADGDTGGRQGHGRAGAAAVRRRGVDAGQRGEGGVPGERAGAEHGVAAGVQSGRALAL